MNEGRTGRIPSKLAKGIGGLTVILGGVWVMMALWPLVRVVLGAKEVEDGWVLCLMVPLMATLGILVIHVGRQFLHEVNLPNLKLLVGVYSAFGAIWISARLSDRFSEVLHQRVASGLLTFGTAVFGISIYLFALRWLMPALGMRWTGFRSVLAKGAFTLLTWLLWLALSSVGYEMFNGSGELHSEFLVLCGPIFVAWGFHVLAVKWLKAGQQAPTSPSS